MVLLLLILGCETWTTQNDYGGFGDRSSTARTVEECRTECSNNVECTAIDWVGWLSTGSQCWLVGPWTTWSRDRPGIQRHSITRTCGLQCLYICYNWILRYFHLHCYWLWVVIWNKEKSGHFFLLNPTPYANDAIRIPTKLWALQPSELVFVLHWTPHSPAGL